jgi:hypothetical protein
MLKSNKEKVKETWQDAPAPVGMPESRGEGGEECAGAGIKPSQAQGKKPSTTKRTGKMPALQRG